MLPRIAGTGMWRYALAVLLFTLGLGAWVKVVSAGLPATTRLPQQYQAAEVAVDTKGGAEAEPGLVVTAAVRTGVDYRPARPASVLYDQLTGAASPNSASSQNFESARDGYDDQLADDFIVPAGQTWTVDQVEVLGAYDGTGPAASVNVFVYSNSVVLPGAAVFTQTEIAYTPGPGNYGDFVIPLDPPATLGPGTYWISVQANLDYATAGQWFWRMRYLDHSNEWAAWRNPGGGFRRFDCVSNWGNRRETCHIGWIFDGDQMFRLSGVSNATPTNTVTGTPPTLTSTRTATPISPTPTATDSLPPPVLTQPPQITPATTTPTNTPVPACGANWRLVASPEITETNWLVSVAATSANDAWAVGVVGSQARLFRPLTEHWDGQQWSIIPSPNPSAHSYLYSVSAVSSNDVWAVGEEYTQFDTWAIAMHWDGAAWTRTVVPTVPLASTFRGVVAVGTNDVWAVGYYTGLNNHQRTLTMHWDGTQWSFVPSPNSGTGNNMLASVSGNAAKNVWAVGSQVFNPLQPLVLHWDGTGWTSTYTPISMQYATMNGVTVTPTGNVWAVGAEQFGGFWIPRTWHLSGGVWSVACCSDSPSGSFFGVFASVAASSDDDIWTVGFTTDNPARTVIMHGGSQVPSRNIGLSTNQLLAVASLPSGEAWAVGSYFDTDIGLTWPLAQRYNDPCVTPSPTVTGTRPTLTPQRTGTPVSTFTHTHTATASATISSATATRPTSTRTPTPTGTATPSQCGPGRGGWSQAAPFPTPLSYMAVVEHVGLFYSFGGWDTIHAVQPAWKFDPGANTWTAISPLPAPRAGARAVSDGTYIYILGGQDFNLGYTNSFYRYDPVTDTYTTLAASPIAVAQHGAVYLNGKIYRIGGATTGPIYLSSVQAYTISTDSWATVASYPQTRASLSAVAYGGYIYTAGGSSAGAPTNKTYRYDPSSNSWDDNAIADLPTFVHGAVSGLYMNLWIIAGGYVGAPASNQARAWDPTTNTWLNLPSMPLGRYFAGGGVVGGGFYSLGGLNSNVGNEVENQRYIEMPCDTPTATATRVATFTATGTATGTPTSTHTPSATPTPTLCPISFSDVQPSDYFYEAVHYLYCHGAISGYGDGTFRPYNLTTRGQLTKIVVLAQGWGIYTPSAPTFRDVPVSHAFFQYVETAYQRGIISGYECGAGCLEFRPGNNVTRGQLCKIVVLARGWPLYSPPRPTFRDVAPDNPFYAQIETAYTMGIISGYECGASCLEFRPGNNATRGQISKIVYLAVTQP